MTTNEIAIFVGGTLLAYWVVSAMLGGKAPPRPGQPPDATAAPLAGSHPGASGADAPELESASESASQDAAPRAPREPAWFEVLGVPEQATRAEILAAYKVLMMRNHPDRVATMGPEFIELAERRSREINAACDEGLKVRTT